MEFLKKLSARNKDAWSTRPLLIAVLGDSVSHGCFDVFYNEQGRIDTLYDPESGYAAQLQRRLRRLYPAAAVTVMNAGVSGNQACHGLARLERDVLSRDPDLVIVAFGLNDCMEGLEALARYESSLRGIFAGVQAHGAECMLLTEKRMCSYVSCHLTDPRLREGAAKCAQKQNDGTLDRYMDAARSVAAEMRVPVADAYAVWNRLEAHGVDTTAMLSNYTSHPTPEASEIFVDVILETLMR